MLVIKSAICWITEEWCQGRVGLGPVAALQLALVGKGLDQDARGEGDYTTHKEGVALGPCRSCLKLQQERLAVGPHVSN